MFTIKSFLLLAFFLTGVNAVAIPTAAPSNSFWSSLMPRSTDPDSEAIERAVQSPLNETTANAAANANGLAGVPPAPPVANAHPVDTAAGAKADSGPANAAVANGTVPPAPNQAPLHFLNNEANKLVGGPSGETPACQSACQPLWVEVVNVCNRDLHCTCNNTVAAKLEECYNCDLRERHANWMSVFAIQRTFNAYTAQCRQIGQPVNLLRASALPPPKSAASATSVKLVSVIASVSAALAFTIMA
jgi:hypothetical protein